MKKAPSGISPVFAVNRKAPKSLYKQVYEGYRQAIVGGNLRAGQRVPSTRVLAAELGISRIPAVNAYAQLLAEGYFESRVGSGTFVCASLPSPPAAPADRRAAGERARRRFHLPAIRSPLLPPYERPPWMRGQGAFSFSQPDRDAFPFGIWSRLLSRYGRNLHARDLQYGGPMGLLDLREAIGAYLRTARGVRCEAAQIMIVSGSQHALDITTRTLLEPGSTVWVEEPGYWLARQTLAAAGCRLALVPVDQEGLNVAAGIKRCPQARAAYVAPSHQYPLGTTMSAARRLQLLDWAESARAWIVEDDYDSEYRYDSNPLASLQGLDEAGRVIYIGTFSKVLFPSLRVGYLVVPSGLVAQFAAVRYAMDVGPPHLPQALLADFLREGHFARHLRRMRGIYGERRKVLVNCLQGEFGERLEIQGAPAGLHLTVTLAKGGRDRSLSLRAAQQNLWLWPLSPAYSGPAPRQGFILGFGGTRTAEIPSAVRRMREILAAEPRR